LAKRIRNLRQISKEDYGVEPEAVQRLKCNLNGEFGRVAKWKHPAGLGADPMVFG
jgi:hypothetical protein